MLPVAVQAGHFFSDGAADEYALVLTAGETDAGGHHAHKGTGDRENRDDEYPVVSSESFYGSSHKLHHGGEINPRPITETAHNTWMLLVFLLCLGCLAVAKYFFPGRFIRLLQSVFGLRFFLQIDKEGIIRNEAASYLLKVNFLLVASLLLVQTLTYFSATTPWGKVDPVLLYGGILLFLALFYVLKHFVLVYLSWLFETPRSNRSYLNNIFVFNHFAGILLLPLVFYEAFSPYDGALQLAWAILVLLNLYKVIRGAYLLRSLADFSVYYLFLYLCAVELAPLLILGKAVTIYMF